MRDFIVVPTSKSPESPQPAIVNVQCIQAVTPIQWASGGEGSRILLRGSALDTAWSIVEVGAAMNGTLVLEF